MPAAPESHWLTANEAAKSLGIAERTLRAWQVEPIAKIADKRYFTAGAIIQNRLDREHQKRSRSEQPLSELKARADALDAELIRLRAARTELRNAELRGELVRIEDITNEIGKAARAAGVVMDAMPGKLRRFVPTLNHSDTHFIRETIVEHQNRIADEFSQPKARLQGES